MSDFRVDKQSLAIGASLWILTITPVLYAGEPPEITVEVLDVNPGPVGVEPSEPVVWNGQLFFSADDSDVPGVGVGTELYTAGIATGPILVKDIATRPGDGGVPTLFHRHAAGLTDALIFSGNPGLFAPAADDRGFEPWRTQGTALTTGIVKDINFLEASSFPTHMTTVLGGTHVAFSAFTGFFGREPWITDGTEEGTHNVGNIAPDGSDSDPYKFTALNPSQFVFIADDGAIDYELYVSNGFTSTLLKDINPEPNDSSDPQFLTTFVGRNKVVFFAFDEIAGQEPWVTDGTPAGTSRLADINPGPASSNNDSDGGAAGFVQRDNAGFVQVGDLMYFSADDGTTGRELWVTDGTPGGTQMVTEVVPGPGGGYFAQAAAFQGLLYFAAQGPSLWRSDGTPGGTTEVVGAIFPPGMRELTPAGDLLYFAAGSELWVSDGTAGGTVSVQGFNSGQPSPYRITAFGSASIAFRADNDAAGTEMFIAYPTSLGPDTEGPIVLEIFPPPPLGTFEDWFFVATAHELDTGGANVIEIEFQLDGAGEWIHLEPLDEGYDSPVESGIDSVRFATVGIHQMCVRGTDQHLNIGVPTCVDIDVALADTFPPVPPVVDIDPNQVLIDESATLSVTATDVGTGDRDILLIEYQIDGGIWTWIQPPLDGSYDEPTEDAEVDLSFDTDGMKNICARATDDAFNTGSPACVVLQVDAPDPTIRLRAIEVNQVIQNWRNEVPLYRGKATVVRVFLERTDAGSPGMARGVLHGSIGGNPLASSPLLPDSELFSFVADDASAFTLIDGGDSDSDPDDAIDSWRAGLRNSVNFTLPATWIDLGSTVDLEFELTSPLNQVVECAEPDGNPDCIVSVVFETINRPLIEFFAVPYNRNEIRQLTVNATGGDYVFVSGNRESDPVAWDAGQDEIEDAIEDALDSRDGRVVVQNGRVCGTPGNGFVYSVILLRGQGEVLAINDSGLAGSASMLFCEAGGPTIAPTNAHLQEQVRRVSDVFPSRGVDFRLRQLNDYNRAPTLLKVNNRISKTRKFDKLFGSFRPGTKSFGFLLERGPTSTKSGLAWLNVSSAYSGFAEEPEDGGYRRSTGAHEGSHTYGRAHAVVFDQGALGSVGLCGSKFTDIVSPLHPFVEITGIENESAAEIDDSLRFTWPTIGPLSNGPDEEIWGFSPRAYANGPGFGDLVVIDPRMSAELMSYCDPPVDAQNRWVSTFTYEILRNRLGGAGRGGSSVAPGLGSGEYMVVAGSIDDLTGEVEMEPAIRVSGLDPGNDPGDLHIALVDGVGIEIESRDVALLVDGDHPSLGDGVGPEPMAFNAAIPIPDGSNPAGIVLTLDAQEIAQVMASANPPTVTITSPTGGSVASGVIPIAWDAVDLDSDPLSVTILYSIDLGLTWKTLATDLEGSSYDAPTDFLEGSLSALIRVLVSDGFHTAEATSNAFEVDAGYPTASIEIPVNGIAVEPGGVLHLRGDAWDPEDGLLEGFQLLWTTDDGGAAPRFIGFGGAVDLPASQLTTGCQLITLTATDSAGKSGTESVEVDIGATGCLGLFFTDGFESGDASAWSSIAP